MKSDHGYRLVYFGSEILSSSAVPVESFTPDVAVLADDMHTVMHQSKGIGLAAPQIAVPLRMVVINLSSVNDGPILSLVNPSIVWDSKDSVPYEEGCLSVPGIYCDVLRPSSIVINGFSAEGKPFELEADGLLARVLQHEIDHLDGYLFIDRIDEYVKKELTRELKKIKKMNR